MTVDSQTSYEAASTKAKIIKLADSLYGLQATKNKGQGIQCVKDICAYLRNGDIEEARKVYNGDGDKIADKFPDVDEYICLNLNCKPRYGIKKWKPEARHLSYTIGSILGGLVPGKESTVLGVSVVRLSKDRYWTEGIREGNSIPASEIETFIKQKLEG